jgi:hypothetical protein
MLFQMEYLINPSTKNNNEIFLNRKIIFMQRFFYIFMIAKFGLSNVPLFPIHY